MIFSTEMKFSDDQAVTGDEASDNIIDLKGTGTVLGAPAALVKDLGKGNPIPILIQVTEAFDELTTLHVSVQTDDNESFTTPKDIVNTYEVPLASLVAGYQFPIISVPQEVVERYLRLHYEVTGSAPTAGKITAGIVMAVQTNKTVPGA
jgi:hypothetical protein